MSHTGEMHCQVSNLPVPICLLLSLLLMMVQGWWVLRVCLLFFCPSSFVCLLSWEVLHPFLLFKSKKCRRMKKGYLGEEAARQRNEGAGWLLAKDLQRELLLEDDRWDYEQTLHDKSVEGWKQWIKRSFVSQKDGTNSGTHKQIFLFSVLPKGWLGTGFLFHQVLYKWIISPLKNLHYRQTR